MTPSPVRSGGYGAPAATSHGPKNPTDNFSVHPSIQSDPSIRFRAMPASSVRLAAHAHKPLIRFLGKRTHDKPAPLPTYHPLAPQDIKVDFSKFAQMQRNPKPVTASSNHSSQSPSNQPSYPKSQDKVLLYGDSSELPWGYLQLTPEEIELVNGGGVIR
ncbi:hypothetical protein O181_093841 [Austropuccinia psidii MF-1]|uniref:Uncharacterized protein n=1 Tax=Austropuccinia psidii MF-1 TaxID=1389203 RepID=A0A9Q3J231_9BASI|nr:hypothetical protein [Austropuccinia psidii MF-1]